MRFFLAIALVSSASAAVPTQFISAGPGGGGALFAPSFNPFHAGEIYLACDMSEVFHSTNYGSNWNVVNFQQIAKDAGIQWKQNALRHTCISALVAIEKTCLKWPMSREIPRRLSSSIICN